mmetsp:Transcript_17079/g.39724  ORF Transcript_17079/g.39724 Transcript_17079/m.39724 type:complete len:100 (+) Transcript_17079:403-702(+)
MCLFGSIGSSPIFLSSPSVAVSLWHRRQLTSFGDRIFAIVRHERDEHASETLYDYSTVAKLPIFTDLFLSHLRRFVMSLLWWSRSRKSIELHARASPLN